MISRRDLLRSSAAGAALLPLLRREQEAWGAGGPKRLFIIVWTNGALNSWPREYSKTDETVFTLPEILTPLDPHKKDIVLLGGLDLKVAADDKNSPGRLHHSFSHITTGAMTLPLDKNGGIPNALSIDQFIANDIAKKAPTPIKSLELGLWKNSSHIVGRFISLRGPAVNNLPQGNLPEIDPFKVYARVFGAGLPLPGAGAENDQRLMQIRRERKSLFDFVGRDLAALSKRLGAEDRQKVETHVTAMRSVEMELDALQASVASGKCASPMMPDPARLSIKSPENIPAVSKLQIDLAVAAMACNLTRVVTYAMGDGGNDEFTFPWLGIDFRGKGDEYGVRSHHDIAHRAYDSPDHTRRKTLVDQWFFSQFAYVLERMKQIPEGGGTMLDNTLVCMFNSGSEGSSHVMDRLPWVIGGRAGGYLKTGRYLKLNDWAQTTYNKASKLTPHNSLLVSIANAFDVPTRSFGDPAYGEGELPGLRG